MPRIVALLLAATLALAAAAQSPHSEPESRASALKALEDADARVRLGGVVYFGRNGLAADGPLLVKRLSDPSPMVRNIAGQAVWLVWGRSGDEVVDRLLESGIAEMDAKRYPRAIEIFSDVIRRRPDFAEGWNKRATAYYLMGDYTRSLADCDEVLKRNPHHFGALAGYGMIYLQLDQPARALEYLERALAVNPNLSSVRETVEMLKRRLIQRRKDTI
jgi:tetratricopeptide (TPR) repeat protein